MQAQTASFSKVILNKERVYLLSTWEGPVGQVQPSFAFQCSQSLCMSPALLPLLCFLLSFSRWQQDGRWQVDLIV